MAVVFRSILTALMLALAGCQVHPGGSAAQTPAQSAAVKLWYLDPAAIDRLKSVLPGPPQEGDALSRGEGDFILALQAEATPTAKARAKSEESLRGWNFADVLGPNFNADSMPLTGFLLRQAEQDSAVVTRALKDRWGRKRPPVQDDRIVASLGLPKESSYPSGHSVRAMMWAKILSMLVPDKQPELLQRARLMAYDRVIGGVHYPTDVAAGLTLGSMIADELAQSTTFQSDLAKARAEWPRKSP